MAILQLQKQLRELQQQRNADIVRERNSYAQRLREAAERARIEGEIRARNQNADTIAAAQAEAATTAAQGKVYVAGVDADDKIFVSTCYVKPCTTAANADIVFNELDVAE